MSAPSERADDAAPVPGGPQLSDDDIERLRRMVGGRAGLVDGAVPALLFVIGNALWSLQIGAAIAGGYGVAAVAYRRARKQPLGHAVAGLAGLALSLGIALVTRNPTAYFVPGTVWGFLAGSLFIVTAFANQPVSTVWAIALERKPKEYYALPEIRRLHRLITLVWGSTLLGRAAIRGVLIANDETELLAATSLILGYPLTALLAGGTIVLMRRASRRVGTLPTDSAEIAGGPAPDGSSSSD